MKRHQVLNLASSLGDSSHKQQPKTLHAIFIAILGIFGYFQTLHQPCCRVNWHFPNNFLPFSPSRAFSGRPATEFPCPEAHQWQHFLLTLHHPVSLQWKGDQVHLTTYNAKYWEFSIQLLWISSARTKRAAALTRRLTQTCGWHWLPQNWFQAIKQSEEGNWEPNNIIKVLPSCSNLTCKTKAELFDSNPLTTQPLALQLKIQPQTKPYKLQSNPSQVLPFTITLHTLLGPTACSPL